MFVMNSHRSIMENQNLMNENEFKEVFTKLKLVPRHITLKQISHIFEEITKHNNRKAMDALEFNESLKHVAQIVFDVIEQEDSEMEEENPIGDLLLVKFYDKYIHTQAEQ